MIKGCLYHCSLLLNTAYVGPILGSAGIVRADSKRQPPRNSSIGNSEFAVSTNQQKSANVHVTSAGSLKDSRFVQVCLGFEFAEN
jgi:hypothetical protein